MCVCDSLDEPESVARTLKEELPVCGSGISEERRFLRTEPDNRDNRIAKTEDNGA